MVVSETQRRVVVVLGTRPEAIKLAPVIRLLREADGIDLRVISTGQHIEMLSQVLEPMGVQPDVHLDVMQTPQALNEIVAELVPRMDRVFGEKAVDMVVVQGDTTSAFSAALAAFHRRILVGHVEAGLRSFNRFHPYPEECNRRMISALADLHFAPTAASASNLLREGVPRDSVFITGNTTVDSLLHALRSNQLKHTVEGYRLDPGRRLVLITLHRRESWLEAGDKDAAPVLSEILRGVVELAEARDDVDFVYPMHKNPRVRRLVEQSFLVGNNVHLLEPIPYVAFVRLMAASDVILTDSGGIQEEAPSLGVPVLVAREVTERQEALRNGQNRIVGTHASSIRDALATALAMPAPDRAAVPYLNPHGDGRAAERIRDAILSQWGMAQLPEPFAVIEH